LYYSPIFKQL